MKFDRTKNALRNIIFGLLQRIYQLIVPFAMRTAMIYWLGVEYLGLDGLFISVLSVLNLAELGVGSAMVYSMYKPVAEDDRTTICALMKLYKIYYRVIGLVVLVGGLILCPFIPKLISDELPAGMNVYILFLLNLGATVLSYWLFAYKNSILQAYQRADVVSKVTMVVNTIRYAAQFVILFFQHDYYMYLIVTLVSQAGINIATAVVAEKIYPHLKPEGSIPDEQKKVINGRISCTAATATCNYLPAMKEAYERNIQLVALTADQNPYEMFHMEDQCIDQVDMFHGYVKLAVDVPKVMNDADYWYCNRRMNEAFLELDHHGKGPIQINYHMSYDLNEISTYDVEELPVTRKIDRYEINADFAEFANMLSSKKRIMVVGGSEFTEDGKLRRAINTFTEKYNAVVIADTYANIYSDNDKIFNPKALGDTITADQVKYLAPDLIISFGAVYYSTIKYFMPVYSNTTEHWQICIDGMINDGYHCLKNVFEMKPEEFFERVNVYADTVNNGEYAVRWKKRMDIVHFPELGFTNLAVIKEFCKTIPDNSLLHTTVLDSIRMSNYVEMKPSIRCFANIGADGIDGALSTYLGQGESEEKPVYLLIGDLSLMYDMNALLQKLPHNIRIVVINNYSGAEFHKNFGLDRIPTLNKHIAAGHRVKIANCCINSQFKYLAATNMEEVREALTILNTESEKPILLEVFTDADKDAKILKSYWMTNRQEIPGMKLSGKARVKQIVRNILGNKAYAIREMFKK